MGHHSHDFALTRARERVPLVGFITLLGKAGVGPCRDYHRSRGSGASDIWNSLRKRYAPRPNRTCPKCARPIYPSPIPGWNSRGTSSLSVTDLRQRKSFPAWAEPFAVTPMGSNL